MKGRERARFNNAQNKQVISEGGQKGISALWGTCESVMVKSTAAAIWVLREYVTDLAPLRHIIDKRNREKPSLHRSQLIVEQ